MARQFKPLRFFVMMGAAAFIVCGVTAFYTHRAAHGRTPEERAAYAIGERAGEQAPRDAKLPTAAELNMMAQKFFEQQGLAINKIGTSLSKTVTRTGLGKRIRSEQLNKCCSHAPVERSHHLELDIVDGAYCRGYSVRVSSVPSQGILNENPSRNV
jgi:hypothetical protein